jgi:uncharacterized circularly permuted ATP-grasp superfamily protein
MAGEGKAQTEDSDAREGAQHGGLFRNYAPGAHYCEYFGKAGSQPANPDLIQRLARYAERSLRQRNKAAEQALYDLGITFTVYSGDGSIDRVLPFDLIPRPIQAAEWAILEAGIIQRIEAVNCFLRDIYGARKIIADGIVPADLILKNKNYLKEMEGVEPPGGVYTHVSGTDLIRDADGVFRVLEDNCRTPSGVSYVVENRHLMRRSFPDLMDGMNVRAVSHYGARLRQKLLETAPACAGDNPTVVLLTPGVFNSAYFEHVFLAREMGAPLVEGKDLFVDDDDVVQMRTIGGHERVDVIYRRVDDAFLDPETFREDSLLGTPGLMRAYRAGNLTIANAPGTGVADDKAIYAYMPRIIEYYLGGDPILPNVATWVCREPEALAFVLDRLDQLVVKPVGESGGYGVVIGPKATKKELEELRAKVVADPANFIAQPVIDLSVCPTLTEKGVQPRHVDLRPFALTSRSGVWVMPGGLTRVALKEGSLIVNSSQGGGSKDTWVLS